MEPGPERRTPVPASSSAIQKQQLVQTEGLTRFTRWLFEQIEPFLNGAVWEAGCGTGTYTQHMLSRGCGPIVATDLDEDVLTAARRRFDGDPRVAVFPLDLSKPDEYRKLTRHAIQTIVCLNVLEHLEDDRMVLRQMRQLLQPGGRLLLLVPAHPVLFNGIDESVHHYRRYTARELREKLEERRVSNRPILLFQCPRDPRLGSLRPHLGAPVRPGNPRRSLRSRDSACPVG